MRFMNPEELLAGRLFPSRTYLTSSRIKSLKDEGVLSVKYGSLSWRSAASNNKSDIAGPKTGAKVVTLVFGGILQHTQGQACSDHTQPDIFTLQGNIYTFIRLLRSSDSSITRPITRPQSYADSCPAYWSTKVIRLHNITKYTDSSYPTSSKWKQTAPRMLVTHLLLFILQKWQEIHYKTTEHGPTLFNVGKF